MSKGNRFAVRIILTTLGVGIGFFALFKPVHIDDPVVLHVAQNILRNPLDPFAGEFFWLAEPEPLFKTTTNPPLVSYWLAPFIALGGYREWWLHLSYVPFVGLLGWGVYLLGRRWLGASQVWWAVGWVLLSPAVLPGMNLMRDVPAMALFVAGMACWVEGWCRNDRRWLIAGALLGGLSALAKYTALYWVVLALMWSILFAESDEMRSRQRAWKSAGWLLIALVPIGLWSLHNLWVYGEPHLSYLWQERRGSAPWEAKFLPAIVGIGASVLLSLPALFLWLREGGWTRILVLIAMAGSLVAWHRHFYADQPFHWQSLVWLINGGILLLVALGTGRTDSHPKGTVSEIPNHVLQFLRVWVAIALITAVWGVPFQAMRHLLFLLPPLVLLLGRYSLQRAGWLIAQGIICLLVLVADYEYAHTYRHFAQLAQERWGSERVWYVGSWGWMFYAEQAGVRKVLPSGEGLLAGDLVLIPERVYKGNMPPDSAQRLELLAEFPYRARLPLRTMDAKAGAFYYALIRGRAPFAFTLQPTLEQFRVYRWNAPP